ncbi:MFS transporter [Cochlodiniinecator piscidefendens]|uniref:MFS transporter n=1 Tax=Cochlodiniinecator piscidefendens TaxID=2715756 RepID=UPI001408710C|nr:MFS transporter [Cochlodiniinecator piscidefendens]
MMTKNQKQALAGAALLSFVLGSLHAFSVLLLAMEIDFGVSRSAASVTYSIALASLAAAVLMGHTLYARFTPAVYVTMVGMLAAAGCALAAFSSSMVFIWLGFGLIFGTANGLGYGYALQFSGRILPENRGFAMGLITAIYALGAVMFPIPLRIAANFGGWVAALLFLAICLLLISALSAISLKHSRMHYVADAQVETTTTKGLRPEITWLWFSYCGAVTAGLMIIGHATGIIEARGSNPLWITAAPIIIALANMVGSLLGGVLTDKRGGRSVLLCLSILSTAALLFMAFSSNWITTLIGLAIVGFAYGGTIAAYPAYISHRFGTMTGTVIYGRVFTAWAAAGLLGPSAAGVFFDQFNNYQAALILAALAAAVSLILLVTKIKSVSEAQ